jgi:hypothetical protein
MGCASVKRLLRNRKSNGVFAFFTRNGVPMMARGRDFKDWEVKWAARYGFDIRELRQQITKDFNSIKSGQAFMGASQIPLLEHRSPK